MKPTAVGCYIFAGGFTLGVERHFKVLAHLEGHPPYGASTARLNWPDMPVHSPPESWPLADFAGADLVYCNPPCAIFSVAGARPGGGRLYLDDPRVECWRHCLRVLEACRPRVWMLESVTQAYTVGRPLVDEFTKRLLMAGYSVTHLFEDARWFGLPQRRQRFLIVAHRSATMSGLRLNWSEPPLVGDVLSEVDDPGPCSPINDRLRAFLPHVKPGSNLRKVWESDRRRGGKGRPAFLSHRLSMKEVSGAFVGDHWFHPTKLRRIGVNEAKALCGFPQGFRLDGGTAGAFSLLARGVLPPVAERLAAAAAETAGLPDAGWSGRSVTRVDLREPSLPPVDITGEYLDAAGRVRIRVRAAQGRPLEAAATAGQGSSGPPARAAQAASPVRQRAPRSDPKDRTERSGRKRVAQPGIEPDDAPPREGEGSGAYMRRVLLTGRHSPDEIVALVHQHWHGRTTKVTDVYFNHRLLKDSGHYPALPEWPSARRARPVGAPEAAGHCPRRRPDRRAQEASAEAQSAPLPTELRLANWRRAGRPASSEAPQFAVDAALPPEARFWQFARERHRAHLNRAAGLPAPWTRDTVLRTFRFTNMYRDLDAVTAWLIENWYAPNRSDAGAWFSCCLARRLNRVDSMAELGYMGRWEPDRWSAFIAARRERGQTIFGKAYRIMVGTTQKSPGGQPAWLADKVFGPLWAGGPMPDSVRTIEAAVRWLRGFYGWGPFLAHQAVLDMVHCTQLADAPDRATFAVCGPGATLGLAILAGGDVLDYSSNKSARLKATYSDGPGTLAKVRRIADQQGSEWPGEWPPLSVANVEHAVCEFYKYETLRAQGDFPPPIY